MILLLDLALAILVLTGALFLGATATALIKTLLEPTKKETKDDENKSA